MFIIFWPHCDPFMAPLSIVACLAVSMLCVYSIFGVFMACLAALNVAGNLQHSEIDRRYGCARGAFYNFSDTDSH